MTLVFVYEHVTAVGLGRDPGSPEHSLHVEGRAMRDAVTADLTAVPGVEVLTFPDGLPEAEQLPAFRERSARADWSLVIAPETGGDLERLAREVVAVGGRLLGPNPDAIALTADKLRLAEWWQQHGVPTPITKNPTPQPPPRSGEGESETPSTLEGVASEASRGRSLTFPLVLKPRDGAGSDATFLVQSPAEFDAALAASSGQMIAQEFVAGRPASVAFLLGPRQVVPLVPAFQRLTSDGRFKYLGGELPIPADLAERAVRLGWRAIECVPGVFGYVGVDLILGPEPDGAADFAIEINPRLTTSYVGLRAAAEVNLAGAMLVVCGGVATEPRWREGGVSWRADGTVRAGGAKK
jgi:predicted ATP-grasp superfamily ATP-dependent carboligase